MFPLVMQKTGPDIVVSITLAMSASILCRTTGISANMSRITKSGMTIAGVIGKTGVAMTVSTSASTTIQAEVTIRVGMDTVRPEAFVIPQSSAEF
jgi:subtilase family serine protease